MLLALAQRRGDVRENADLAAVLVVARLVTLAEEGLIGLDGGRVAARDAAGERADAAETGAVAQGSAAVAPAGPVPVSTPGLDPVFDQVRKAEKGVSVRELIECRTGRARVARSVERLAADGAVRLVPDPGDPGGIDTLVEVSDRAAVGPRPLGAGSPISQCADRVDPPRSARTAIRWTSCGAATPTTSSPPVSVAAC